MGGGKRNPKVELVESFLDRKTIAITKTFFNNIN